MSRLAALAVLSLGWLGLVNALSTGTFTWPATARQCGTYNVTIYNGAPPWTLVLAPINGQPIYWDITAPPRYDSARSVDAQIPLQLESGTAYTVFMMDSSGYFTGVNPTQVQVVGLGTDSSCLTDVIAHSQDFTFTVAGSTAMCEDDFQLSWLDQVGTGPYNFTVLPLDSSTNPWDQSLSGGGTTTGASGWAVNMTTGTRFTIMMNNGYAYGAGGVGGIYQVAEGSSNSCISAPIYTTAAWPAGLQTTTILTAAQLPTSVITSRSARASASDLSGDEGGGSVAPTTSREIAPPVITVTAPASSGGGLSTGATAGLGAGVGVAALAAIIIGAVFWWRKKKRGGPAAVHSSYAAPVDLNDDTGHGPRSAVEPKIEPYPSPGLSQQPEMAYAQSNNNNNGNFSQSNISSPTEGHGSFGQYGMATAAGFNQQQQQQQQQHARSSMAYSDNQLSPIGSGDHRYSMASSGAGNNNSNPQVNPYFPTPQPSGPGQAGPLPSKAELARQSYQPAQTNYGSSTGHLTAPQSPGSVSGSSSSGRGLPMPPGIGALSESGASDSKTNLQSPHSHAPTQGHGGQQGYAPVPQEPMFNIHRDAEAEPAQQGGMIDLPPMYQDVPQTRRDAGDQAGSGAQSPQTPLSRDDPSPSPHP